MSKDTNATPRFADIITAKLSSTVLCVAVLGILLVSKQVKSEVLFAWSQVVEGSNLSIRAVISAREDCPLLEVEGEKTEMQIRSLPITGVFDDIVCESLLPPSGVPRNIRIGDRELPDLRRHKLDNRLKVAVLGDTGCRVANSIKQDCKSSDGWALRRVLSGIASHSPDVVVHVGDFLYREVACVDKEKCDTNVFGDNSATWAADWLTPMEAVSSDVVFVFVRGNHEDCNRAHIGWFRYLDAMPYYPEANCEDILDSWVVDLEKWGIGSAGMYIHDSSSVRDENTDGEYIEGLREKFFKNIGATKSLRMMLLFTHRPFWAYSERNGLEYYGNLPLIRAIGEELPDNFKAIVSGHVHLGEMVRAQREELSDEKDPQSSEMRSAITQIISGNGGTILDKGIFSHRKVFSHYNYTVDVWDIVQEFGFCILDIVEAVGKIDTSVTFHNVKDTGYKKFVIGQEE